MHTTENIFPALLLVTDVGHTGMFLALLAMAVATTLIAPPFLVRLFRDEEKQLSDDLLPVTPIS